jgi:lipopolysaccharide export system protein LptA
MRKSEAARYARWSAATALILAALTVGVYLKRGWTRHVERKNAPEAAPVNVERQSSHLMFSKGEGTQKVFTVEASKSIDFKGLNASDLEGVKITIFGKDGARHDTMETHTCRYAKDSGDIVCAGDVEIILMSAEVWKVTGGKPGAPGAMKIETRGMAFNRASGQAKTDEQVRFSFATGSGQALGAEYHSEEGTLRLQRDVQLKLDQPVVASGNRTESAKKEPVEITGSRMDFSRDRGTIYLSGPAEAKTQGQRMTAAGMLVELDENFHAKRLIAKSNGNEARPEFIAEKGADRQELSADEITASFAPAGWITRAEATGNVNGESQQGQQTQSVRARNASLEMLAGQNAPRLLVLTGAVDARMNAAANQGGDARRLTTEELRLVFAENNPDKGAKTDVTRGTKLASAESPRAGRLELSDGGNGSNQPSSTVVQADQLAMRFDGGGKAARLDAKGNVRTERTIAGADKQTATAKNGFVDLQPPGSWSLMDLSDNVQLNQGTRWAQADHAEFARAEQTVTLTGHALARDATSLTSAKKLTLWQATGEIRGEGGVRSSDLSARGGAVQLAPIPANVTADQLAANAKTGRALYTGHARLWQGDSVLQGDSIELLRNERIMNAVGNVRAVFPQSPAHSKGAAPVQSSQPVLWHAQSAKMIYWDKENRARLEQNVVVQSPDEKITGQTLDLYFTRGGGGASAAPQTAPANSSSALVGSQQITRAVANGGVTVEQGQRKATADRGEYTAAEGKFVMSGGKPTIFDATEGTTIGRQLTFFLADATIIVDSENGSRTLTRHRVEK